MLPPYLAVDGGWGDWGLLSVDSPINCLQERKRKRTRATTCTNPPPQEDGFDCRGESTESQICSRDKFICFFVAVLLLKLPRKVEIDLANFAN